MQSIERLMVTVGKLSSCISLIKAHLHRTLIFDYRTFRLHSYVQEYQLLPSSIVSTNYFRFLYSLISSILIVMFNWCNSSMIKTQQPAGRPSYNTVRNDHAERHFSTLRKPINLAMKSKRLSASHCLPERLMNSGPNGPLHLKKQQRLSNQDLIVQKF